MKRFICFYLPIFILTLLFSQNIFSKQTNVSEQTEECLGCHSSLHPGLVASWLNSRHSKITPYDALQKEELERRISSGTIDSSLLSVSVGCYECHSLNTDKHKDSFEHNGYTINLVVSPNDCSTCHPVEVEQYSKNIMDHAYFNLMENSLYRDLMKSVNNPYHYSDSMLKVDNDDELTNDESCLYCHGTKIEVTGVKSRDTDFGELEFPVLKGWPNQGVGRVNPDGSLGSCTACHSRHDFSIETARKPYTCSECHKGPDVPAFKVYEASKHGNIFESVSDKFNFDNVPWTVGKDFTSPTCATCHASLVVSDEGTVIAERSHQFNDRLAWRLFGVPYSHPHSINTDLRAIKNSAGLPLLTELDGKPVSELVINKEEQDLRNTKMKTICLSCHSADWVNNHFARLQNTITKSNELTYEATKMLIDIWKSGYVEGLPQGKSIFDDEIEREWTSLWLFHTNSTRFASAMSGGGDYGVFADGRYGSTEKLLMLMQKLKDLKKEKEKK